MDVRCDRCETEYELDDAIVTDAGASVQCTTCGHTFTVTRRPSSPQGQIEPTSSSGLAEAAGPQIPGWTLHTEDGKLHRFRDLNTLQKWIVERKVTRNEKISRASGSWLALGDVVELAPFFSVVDEADRARATGALHPTSPGRAVSSSAGSARGAAAPAARSPGRQRPISEDGPTVPNHWLPGMVDSSRPAARPADARIPGSPVSDKQSPGIPAPGLRTPDRRPSDSRGSTGRGSDPHGVGAATGTARPIARNEIVVSPVTEETRALETDFLRPSHEGRNLVLGLVALGLVAGGGYWWWTGPRDQIKTAEVAVPDALPGSVIPAVPVVTAPTPSGVRGPAVTAQPSAERVETAIPPVRNVNKSGNSGTSTRVIATTSGGPGGSGASPERVRDAATSVSAVRAAVRPDVLTARGSSYDRLVDTADRLLEQGKSAKADALYAQALGVRPDGVEALTGSAYVLLDRQRHFKAIETFRRALALQPGFGPALFGIAESYRARGDMAQALGAYRQYLAISPSGTDAPAARRQIKDLESAGSASTSERSAQEAPPSSEDH